MLVMFVGNMTSKAQVTNLPQNNTMEVVPFGLGTSEVNSSYVIHNTNTIISDGMNFILIRDAKTGDEKKVVTTGLSYTDEIAGTNGKEHLLAAGGKVYILNENGSSNLLFKFLTSFPREGVNVGITNLTDDHTKVCIYGNFDSIVGIEGCPKFALIYNMVTGSISPLFPPDQEWSVEQVVMFKGRIYFSVNSTKEGRIDKILRMYDPSTGQLSDPNLGTAGHYARLFTDGTTLLMLSENLKYGFNGLIYKLNENTNVFDEKYLGVINATFFKGKCYLNTAEFIKKPGTNEEINANYFVEYNPVNDELTAVNVSTNNFDCNNMLPTKDYLVSAGRYGLRIQNKANGINGYSNASALNIPNPISSRYSFLAPNDYVGSVLTVTDLKGSVLMERKLDGDVVEFNFPAGAYVLQIRNEKTYTIKKIIVR